ncbi:nuclear transport factor 2 family protein [Acinetobacter sp. ME22]|uniref:nuclear transport factor 2 family protein n=1 Tax=Acinetobacter sp. ME22 TaxID=2904802 RepID=UPI001EDB537E|nr:nuclear transport factor 2 family protein [Acinetobacter sp. ME22]MCG2575111.1 nuclear transport factor 2 family protein [Acinetobacter sp. ME22]
MLANTLCLKYLNALNKSNLNGVLELFTDDAKIDSPLYGIKEANVFYKELFLDTSESNTTLLHIFENSETNDSIALHFEYEWTLSNGEIVKCECVDVFYLNENMDKFKKMKIIYDTSLVINQFNSSKENSGTVTNSH